MGIRAQRRINSLAKHGFHAVITHHAASRAALRFHVPTQESYRLIRDALLGNDRRSILPAAEVMDDHWPRYYLKLEHKVDYFNALLQQGQHMYINRFFWAGQLIRIVLIVQIVPDKAIVVTTWRHLIKEMPDLYMLKERKNGGSQEAHGNPASAVDDVLWPAVLSADR